MTTKTATAQDIVTRHAETIGKILDQDIDGDDLEQFVDHVNTAIIRLGISVSFNTEREELEDARTFLNEALAATDPAERAMLLGKADQHLGGIDPDDFDF